jgi:UDP-N-acetylglucosamine/UDP-N-acetylgalactosamine diphosphorylase
MMTMNRRPAHLAAAAEAAGQSHLLEWARRLDGTAFKRLATQLETIDWTQLAELQTLSAVRQTRFSETPASDETWPHSAETPPCQRLASLDTTPRPEAAQRGEAALAAAAVGGILVAGGQGTRLGCDEPKGMYPIGPVSGATLFELLLGKLVAVRKRYGRQVPLAIMTSEATDEATRLFLAGHRFCGLDPDHVLLFRQRNLPALEAGTGRLLLDAPDHVAMAPDGHGGMLGSLAAAGGLRWFAERGVGTLTSFQIDNPLARPLASEFIGLHLLAAADFSTQVVPKVDPTERVGVVVTADGVTRIVEYSDLTADLAAARLPDGRLRFHAGSIAIHAFDCGFLARAAADAGALPLHLAFKAVPHLDAAGRIVKPATPNAYKFERFIFDLMPLARRVNVVEVDPADGFAPLKNPPGSATDAPEHVQAAMVAQARRLLASAGVTVGDGVAVEIDAATILDLEDVRHALPKGSHIDVPTVIRAG